MDVTVNAILINFFSVTIGFPLLILVAKFYVTVYGNNNLLLLSFFRESFVALFTSDTP